MPSDAARTLLRDRFGHDDFRPGQAEAVAAVLDGRDALVVLPTGGGKSLCFQVPALLRDGLTVVLSPLISLMKDQVDALEARGLPAAFINSTLGADAVAERFARVRRGEIKLLYVAPERFDGGRTAERLREVGVSLLAVDEAHCISEWGHDFRPSYRRVREIREALGMPQTVALTATATPAVRRDIVAQLGMEAPAEIVSGFDRRNLRWHVLPTKNDAQKDATLRQLLEDVPGAAIVYASTRKAVERVATALERAGVGARAYHAGLEDAERHDVQDAFMGGGVRVIVATNAFGMGIDKRDVRLVVHYAMPGSLEAYYQEAGRAGRDGAPSECVLLHAFPDRFTHEFLIDGANPEAKVVRQVYDALRRSAAPDGSVAFDAGTLAGRLPEKASDRAVESALRLLVQGGAVQAGTLVRVQLLVPTSAVREVLGDEPSPALDLLRGLWRAAGARLQRGALVDLEALPAVHGAASLTMSVLDELSMLGVVSWGMAEGGVRVADPRADVDAFAVDWDGLSRRRKAELDQLATMQRYAYHEGCRRQFVLRYFGDPAGRGVGACGACDRCLEDEAPFRVIEGTARRDGPAAGRRQRGDRAGRPSAPVPTTSIDEMAPEARARFDALRAWRTDEARRQQKPAYVVLDNKTLQAIAVMQPRTLEALGRVPGIGPAKLEQYGEAVLEVLRRSP